MFRETDAQKEGWLLGCTVAATLICLTAICWDNIAVFFDVLAGHVAELAGVFVAKLIGVCNG